MMAGEQFSLSWSEFHKNLSTGFSNLLEDSTLVDVTLAVEGRCLQAHKVVLSVCSPYFKDLFNNNPCQHPIVFLKDVNYIVIQHLLKFMYQGEVNVRQEDLAEFIRTGEELQVKGLTGTNDVNEKTRQQTYDNYANNRSGSPGWVQSNRSSNSSSNNVVTGSKLTNLNNSKLQQQQQKFRFSQQKKQPPALLPTKRQKSISPAATPPIQKRKCLDSPTAHLDSPNQDSVKSEEVQMNNDNNDNENTKDDKDESKDSNGPNDDVDDVMEGGSDSRKETISNGDDAGQVEQPQASTSIQLDPSVAKEEITQDDIYFIKSLRGSPMLVVGYYTFSRNKRTKTRTYWLCCKAETSKCKVSCIIEDDGVIRMPRGHIHNHPNDMEKILQSEIMQVTMDDISRLFVPSNQITSYFDDQTNNNNNNNEGGSGRYTVAAQFDYYKYLNDIDTKYNVDKTL